MNFRSRSEGKLVFTLSAEVGLDMLGMKGSNKNLSSTSPSLQDDPLAIAATLMPRGQRSNLVWRAQVVCHLTD